MLPSDIYNPYPEYNSPAWRKKWKGTHAACKGPRGVDVNEHEDDMLVAHRLETKGGEYDDSLTMDRLTWQLQ